MCVYFVQAKQGGLIKIGYSKNVVKRLYFLQNGCPVKLGIIGVLKDGNNRDEALLHHRFRGARKYGEWFEPTDEILRFINDNTRLYIDDDKIIYMTDEKITIQGREQQRCRGHSMYTGERCKNAGQYGGLCWPHRQK